MKGNGLSIEVIDQFQKDLALKRIAFDMKSDFIYSPHFAMVFANASEELYEQLVTKMKDGKYTPKLPITIPVNKPNGFPRPGSILVPEDRLAYQLIVDLLAPLAEKTINRKKVFSNKLLKSDKRGVMFENSNTAYRKFQSRLRELCEKEKYKFVFRADVASFFDRLYQHVLINSLNSSGIDNRMVNFLERMLQQFTEKDSHGIIQGVFPSDFLGNFYLSHIDSQHLIERLDFVRYVDDYYIFFKDSLSAQKHKIKLAEWLRKDGLTLNESKSKIFKTEKLIQDETEIDIMFEKALEEINSNRDEWMTHSIYETTLNVEFGFEDKEKNDEYDDELKATQDLYDTEVEYRSTELKIQKFCIPIFSAYNDDYAIDRVIDTFISEPSLSQIYFQYLKSFVRISEVCRKVEKLLKSKRLFDSQKMWLYATLLHADSVSDTTLKIALNDLKGKTHTTQPCKALSAIIIGQFGSSTDRRILQTHYSNEQSEYVKSAIIYSARFFPNSERNSCFSSWSGHSETNALIVKAIKKLEST